MQVLWENYISQRFSLLHISSELANKVGQEDVIIWDNFPDDLVKNDLDSA